MKKRRHKNTSNNKNNNKLETRDNHPNIKVSPLFNFKNTFFPMVTATLASLGTTNAFVANYVDKYFSTANNVSLLRLRYESDDAFSSLNGIENTLVSNCSLILQDLIQTAWTYRDFYCKKSLKVGAMAWLETSGENLTAELYSCIDAIVNGACPTTSDPYRHALIIFGAIIATLGVVGAFCCLMGCIKRCCNRIQFEKINDVEPGTKQFNHFFRV